MELLLSVLGMVMGYVLLFIYIYSLFLISIASVLCVWVGGVGVVRSHHNCLSHSLPVISIQP